MVDVLKHSLLRSFKLALFKMCVADRSLLHGILAALLVLRNLRASQQK